MTKLSDVTKTAIIKYFQQFEKALISSKEPINLYDEELVKTLITNKSLPKSSKKAFLFIHLLSVRSKVLTTNDSKVISTYSGLKDLYDKLWETYTSEKFTISLLENDAEAEEISKILREYIKVAIKDLKKISQENRDLYDFYILVKSQCSEKLNDITFSDLVVEPLKLFGIIEVTIIKYHPGFSPKSKFASVYSKQLYFYKTTLSEIGQALK